MNKSTEVLVIGGGVTGCGGLFDLAQRGFKAILVNAGTNASSRFTACCWRWSIRGRRRSRRVYYENRILRKIMPTVLKIQAACFPTPLGSPNMPMYL
jgi:glycine/D-amino acid oxidase-like deaminating enzyme